MRCLLDTHTFLWTSGRSNRLPRNVRETIENTENAISVSSVSFWEMATKFRRGRLDLGGLQPVDFIEKASEMQIEVIRLEPEEASTVNHLTENTHFDPFDRMLIWQAIRRDLVLISRDTEFRRFEADGLKLFWK